MKSAESSPNTIKEKEQQPRQNKEESEKENKEGKCISQEFHMLSQLISLTNKKWTNFQLLITCLTVRA